MEVPLEAVIEASGHAASKHPAEISAAVPILIAEKGNIRLSLARGRIGAAHPDGDREIADANRHVGEVDELLRGDRGAVLELQVAAGNAARVLPDGISVHVRRLTA